MSNTVGYSLGGCTAGVRYALTRGEDATGNAVALSISGCDPGCWNGDYRERLYWARIPVSATPASGTDYYGALAPDIRFQGGGTYREICPTVCYCEGPVAEGETVTEFLGRYETRWMALLEEGLIYYGRVDGVLIQAPLALFPDPLPDTATHIALSFEANARPVFAYEDDGTIYVRRYVAETPTTYSWAGTYPCLFFNGVVSFDDAQTDVVCYYLKESGGALYARFQRENFEVENLVLEDPGLDSLMAVDRGRSALASFMVIELSGKRNFASMYPLWPTLARDYVTASAVLLSDGDYFPVVVPTDAMDALSGVAEFLTDGDYQPTNVNSNASDALSGSAVFLDDGDYQATNVNSSASDAVSGTVSFTSDGNYYESVVPGGTYTDSQTATAAFLTDGDYTL